MISLIKGKTLMSLMSSICWISMLVLTHSKSAGKWIESIAGTLWCLRLMLTTMNPSIPGLKIGIRQHHKRMNMIV